MLAGCVPPAPVFKLAHNDESYKVPCSQCQEIQAGRTDCGSLSSFYVFFGPPSSTRTIESAKVTISWSKNTPSGSQTVTGTVPAADVFAPATSACGTNGWGVHIRPPAVLPGFTPNPGDNAIRVMVRVRYAGEAGDSEIMNRVFYFLG